MVSSCEIVQFQQVSLYDVYEQPKPQEKIEPIIFDDSRGTLWASLEDCGKFEITNEVPAYTGKSAIKVSWDKGLGCEWIGFGNSFSNWAAADMSQERLRKAFSMYVRTQEKTAKSIPIVLAMEDFAGGGSYHFIAANDYLYGLEMDTTWKRIIVPLWHFPINEEEVDIYSIKQMQFQLEGAGSFYLDDLKLIDYSPEEYQKMRAEVEEMKPKGTPKHTVYTEGNLVEDAWGTGEKICHTLEEKTDSTNNTFIKWKYDATNCDWAQWGINWNGWYQVNFRGVTDKMKLQFKVKTKNESRFKIRLEDFNGHSSEIHSKNYITTSTAEWQTIEIPISDFNIVDKGFYLDQIKQFVFVGLNKGEIYLDDIKITSL